MMTTKRWVVVGAIGIGLAAVLMLGGLDPAHGVVAGLLWVLAIILATRSDLGQHVSLPRLPFGRRDGARTEVSSLSWAMYGIDGINRRAARELRQVCRTALTEARIDIDTVHGRQQAEQILGGPMTAFVVDPDAPPPQARQARATVLALERLEESL